VCAANSKFNLAPLNIITTPTNAISKKRPSLNQRINYQFKKKKKRKRKGGRGVGTAELEM
jgi:hypothetical protein